MTLKTICKNDNDKTAKVYFRVPLLKDVAPYQRVNNLKVTPAPHSYEQDPHHNFYAVYNIEVAPHTAFSVTQSAEVTTNTLISQFSAQSLTQDIQQKEGVYAYSPPITLSSREENLVKNLAKDIVEDQRADLYKIWHTYDYIRSLNFEINEKSRTFRDIIENKTLQCIDAALLQTKLLQALDYKARVANGFIIDTSQYKITVAHAWSEFYTPSLGFIPLDPTQGRFPNTRTQYFGCYDPNYITWYIGETNYGCQVSSDQELSSPPIEITYQVKRYDLAPDNKTKIGSYSNIINPQIPKDKINLSTEEALQYIKEHPQADEFLEELKGVNWNEEQLKILVTLNTPAANLARSYYLINKKDWQQAEDILQRLPSEGQFLKVQAILNYLTRQNQKANEIFEKIDPQSMDEITAEVYWQNWQDQHRWRESLLASKIASRLFPQNYIFKVQVYRAAFNTGDKTETEIAWSDLLQANPQDGYPYLITSQLYLERDDKAACLKAAQEALKFELQPDEKAFCEELVESLSL
ncbi:transglutaminase family protein [bacterium]|nr:transglutaminase family protein [bacterium]